jgi:hypothetical protein
MSGRIDFERVNRAALQNAEAVVRSFLPDGRREGAEWVARNPTRPDHRPGSLKCNLNTGKGADFATGDRWGDLVGMAAYLQGLPQREAAIRLAEALGVNPFA